MHWNYSLVDARAIETLRGVPITPSSASHINSGGLFTSTRNILHLTLSPPTFEPLFTGQGAMESPTGYNPCRGPGALAYATRHEISGALTGKKGSLLRYVR